MGRKAKYVDPATFNPSYKPEAHSCRTPKSYTHRDDDANDDAKHVEDGLHKQPSVSPNVGVNSPCSHDRCLCNPFSCSPCSPSTISDAREGKWSKKNSKTLQFKLNEKNEKEESCGQNDSDYERESDDDINPDDVSSDDAPEDYDDDDNNYCYGHDNAHTKVPRPGRGGGAYSNAMKAARYSVDAHTRVMSYKCPGMRTIVRP